MNTFGAVVRRRRLLPLVLLLGALAGAEEAAAQPHDNYIIMGLVFEVECKAKLNDFVWDPVKGCLFTYASGTFKTEQDIRESCAQGGGVWDSRKWTCTNAVRLGQLTPPAGFANMIYVGMNPVSCERNNETALRNVVWTGTTFGCIVTYPEGLFTDEIIADACLGDGSVWDPKWRTCSHPDASSG